MSGSRNLVEAVFGKPGERAKNRKAVSDELGKPKSGYRLGRGKYAEVYGVWKNANGVFVIRRGRDGCFDPRDTRYFKAHEIRAMASAAGIL